MPIFDKPLIYYPLSTLMLAGIKSIAIVINPEDEEQFKYLLGDGSKLGINIQYFKQENPNGIPEAFTICSSFIKEEKMWH